jgi:hypothetical protein
VGAAEAPNVAEQAEKTVDQAPWNAAQIRGAAVRTDKGVRAAGFGERVSALWRGPATR